MHSCGPEFASLVAGIAAGLVPIVHFRSKDDAPIFPRRTHACGLDETCPA